MFSQLLPGEALSPSPSLEQMSPRSRARSLSPYGNFDVVSWPFLAHISAPYHHPRAVWSDLLRARAYRTLISACNPMFRPIRTGRPARPRGSTGLFDDGMGSWLRDKLTNVIGKMHVQLREALDEVSAIPTGILDFGFIFRPFLKHFPSSIPIAHTPCGVFYSVPMLHRILGVCL